MGALRFTVTISASASGSMFSAGPRWCRPALLTMMSSEPIRSITCLGKACSAARLPTSRAKISALGTRAARSVFSVRATIATFAPSSLSLRDTSSPIPADAPVTSATLSFIARMLPKRQSRS
jgi:hypothetical protein